VDVETGSGSRGVVHFEARFSAARNEDLVVLIVGLQFFFPFRAGFLPALVGGLLSRDRIAGNFVLTRNDFVVRSKISSALRLFDQNRRVLGERRDGKEGTQENGEKDRFHEIDTIRASSKSQSEATLESSVGRKPYKAGVFRFH